MAKLRIVYNLLFQDADTEEEKARQPMSDSELAQMPVLVPESLRFACSDKYCGYKAIDEVMLVYHIDTLHPGQELNFISKVYRLKHLIVKHLKFNGTVSERGAFWCC